MNLRSFTFQPHEQASELHDCYGLLAFAIEIRLYFLDWRFWLKRLSGLQRKTSPWSGRAMLPSSYFSALLTLPIFILPFGQAQSVFSLPQCVQNCISQSLDDNCQITDVKCLCRASSAGNFLPDLISCTHAECDSNLDNDLLLTPLQVVCEIAGVPIPASALANAENQASSLASQPTLTVPLSSPSATASTGRPTTTTSGSSSLSAVTVTETQSGSTVYEVYTTTIDSRESTVTKKTTYTETTTASSHMSSSTDDSQSTTLTTTTVAGAKTSSSSTAKSRTATPPSPDSTNSAPFKDTNGNNAVKMEVLGSWVRLSILISFGFMWL
jgi:hypothetical protein